MTEVRTAIAIRIPRPWQTEEEFIANEVETISRTGILLLGTHSRPQGTILRFEVALAGGQPLVRGEGRVVSYNPAAYRGEPGLLLRFTRLDPRSKAFVDRVAAVRRQEGIASMAPPQGSESLRPGSGGGDGEQVRDSAGQIGVMSSKLIIAASAYPLPPEAPADSMSPPHLGPATEAPGPVMATMIAPPLNMTTAPPSPTAERSSSAAPGFSREGAVPPPRSVPPPPPPPSSAAVSSSGRRSVPPPLPPGARRSAPPSARTSAPPSGRPSAPPPPPIPRAPAAPRSTPSLAEQASPSSSPQSSPASSPDSPRTSTAVDIEIPIDEGDLEEAPTDSVAAVRPAAPPPPPPPVSELAASAPQPQPQPPSTPQPPAPEVTPAPPAPVAAATPPSQAPTQKISAEQVLSAAAAASAASAPPASGRRVIDPPANREELLRRLRTRASALPAAERAKILTPRSR